MFKVGDKLICKKTVYFIDGDKHSEGQFVEVTEGTQSYFYVRESDYELVEEKDYDENH